MTASGFVFGPSVNLAADGAPIIGRRFVGRALKAPIELRDPKQKPGDRFCDDCVHLAECGKANACQKDLDE